MITIPTQLPEDVADLVLGVLQEGLNPTLAAMEDAYATKDIEAFGYPLPLPPLAAHSFSVGAVNEITEFPAIVVEPLRDEFLTDYGNLRGYGRDGKMHVEVVKLMVHVYVVGDVDNLTVRGLQRYAVAVTTLLQENSTLNDNLYAGIVRGREYNLAIEGNHLFCTALIPVEYTRLTDIT